jgi:hypothetical protein
MSLAEPPSFRPAARSSGCAHGGYPPFAIKVVQSPCQPGDRKWDLELFFAEAACWPVAHACDAFVKELNGVAERFGYHHGALEFLRELGDGDERREERETAAPRGEAWRWLGGRLVTDRYPGISPWPHAAWRFHDEEGRESQGQQGAEEGAIPKEVSELAARYVRLLYRLYAEVEAGVDVRMFTKTHRGGSGCDNWDEVVKQKRDYERFVGNIADCKGRFRIELGDESSGACP